jgi:predicted phage terminase large subunit-like protein
MPATCIRRGEREWASLLQQRLRVQGCGLFKIANIGIVEALPPSGQMVRAWDLAATRATRTRDWTVGVLLARSQGDRFCVADVVRIQGGPDEVEQVIVATAQRDGRNVRIGLPQEPGQAGKAQVAYLTSKLVGLTVVSSPEAGDKATRTGPVAAQANVGNLSTVRGNWNKLFLDELQNFSAGAKDDQVDALSRAFERLSGDTFVADYSWVSS